MLIGETTFMPNRADRPEAEVRRRAAPWGKPAPNNRPVSQLIHWVCGAALALSGWRVRGDWPAVKKAVVVAAPHTSNWDGVYMLVAAGYYRVTLKWMGKQSLTRGPFGWLIKALGCVPVDRSASNDLVQAMADVFAARDAMLLAVPPEGTRGLTRTWKSGFYHIARQAGVPIILSVLDYGTRTIEVAAVFYPTGDSDADIAVIRGYYRTAVGKYPSKFTAAD
jgi:1-acyl-sn-glycerol-3-phosphate acyltransferase